MVAETMLRATQAQKLPILVLEAEITGTSVKLKDIVTSVREVYREANLKEIQYEFRVNPAFKRELTSLPSIGI
jgi:hypothetical protein